MRRTKVQHEPAWKAYGRGQIMRWTERSILYTEPGYGGVVEHIDLDTGKRAIWEPEDILKAIFGDDVKFEMDE